MSRLSPLDRVVKNNGFIDAEIDNEVVTLNIDSGVCHGLNRVGSRIWRLLGDPIRIGDICTTLQGEYDVEPIDCERQVLDLLEEMRAEGLIRNADETSPV